MASWGSCCAREHLNAAPSTLAQVPAAKTSEAGVITAGITNWRVLCAMRLEEVLSCNYFLRTYYVRALLQKL